MIEKIPKLTAREARLFELRRLPHGYVRICLAANLPAFSDHADALAYKSKFLGDAMSFTWIMECPVCRWVHFEAVATASSGGYRKGSENYLHSLGWYINKELEIKW